MRGSNLLLGIFIFWSVLPVFGWTDGELLVWISKDKGYHAPAGLGEKCEKDLRVPVKISPLKFPDVSIDLAALGTRISP